MRPIDADDRIEFIKNAYCLECDNYNGVRCRACPINDTIEAIDDAPTIDLWHYPSQGELPLRGEQVLCWLWNGDYVLAFIREDNEWTTNGKNAFDGVRCWQYIEPPKEKK